MRSGISRIGLSVLLVAFLAGTAAVAGLELVKDSTKTVGATTITWNSSFRDLDYSLGADVAVQVDWSVDSGAAMFDRLELKRFTPRSKRDPAMGQVSSVTLWDDSGDGEGTAEVVFHFTGLHLDRERWVEIGNAHFKLYLNIDTDGDGLLDGIVGYGINVHAEDPR